MQLHSIKKISGKKKPVRIARGGKRGSYSGRGVKGQKSRAGRRIRPAVRDLIMRLPKRRGFSNKPSSEKPYAVSIGVVARKCFPLYERGKDIVIVTSETLAQVGIIDGNRKVKILSGGDVKFPIEVRGIPVSKSAKEKIEKAGGKV
ncbi:MAG: uL15 family ribosomal protein [Patescibacteria group bacterium]|nr:uL15 family ribosomal protein [Patescibacteria group bacterium]